MTTLTCERCLEPLTPATSRIRGAACWECLSCKRAAKPFDCKRCELPMKLAGPPYPNYTWKCLQCRQLVDVTPVDPVPKPYGHDWQPRVGGLARYKGRIVQVIANAYMSPDNVPAFIIPCPGTKHFRQDIRGDLISWIKFSPDLELAVLRAGSLTQPTLPGYGFRNSAGKWAVRRWELENSRFCGKADRILTACKSELSTGWTSEPVPAPDDPTPEEFARKNPGRKLNWLRILQVRSRLDAKRPGWYDEWRERKKEAERRIRAAEKVRKEDL